MAILLEAIASHSEKVIEIEIMDRIERNDTIEGLLAEFEGIGPYLSRLEAIDPIVAQQLPAFPSIAWLVSMQVKCSPGNASNNSRSYRPAPHPISATRTDECPSNSWAM